MSLLVAIETLLWPALPSVTYQCFLTNQNPVTSSAFHIVDYKQYKLCTMFTSHSGRVLFNFQEEQILVLHRNKKINKDVFFLFFPLTRTDLSWASSREQEAPPLLLKWENMAELEKTHISALEHKELVCGVYKAALGFTNEAVCKHWSHAAAVR